MVDIISFRGITYNIDKIKDIELVLAPPYDVITPDMQKIYYDNHPNNIIRIIYGMDYPDDNQIDSRYTRAKEYFYKWEEDGIFIRSKKQSLYLYEQIYFINGKERTRAGIVALVRIEDYESGKILPHEETFKSPKEDRLKLIKECEANFCQIFSLYSDPSNKIIESARKSLAYPPFIDVLYDEVRHRLWEIDNPAAIDRIISFMKDKNLLIADGHHRYEAALNYRNLMRKIHKGYSGNEGFNFTMVFLSNIDDEGLTILPTHRIISNVPDGFDFINKIKDYFYIERLNNKDNFYDYLFKINEQSFGIVYNKSYYVIKLKDYNALDNILSDVNPLLKKLDVTILHSFIVDKILKIHEEDISYTKNPDEATDIATKDISKIAVILKHVKASYIMDIARANLRMPHKTTFFYPKLLSGIVINRTW